MVATVSVIAVLTAIVKQIVKMSWMTERTRMTWMMTNHLQLSVLRMLRNRVKKMMIMMMDKVKIINTMLRNRVKMKMIMMMVKINNMMTTNHK